MANHEMVHGEGSAKMAKYQREAANKNENMLINILNNNFNSHRIFEQILMNEFRFLNNNLDFCQFCYVCIVGGKH